MSDKNILVATTENRIKCLLKEFGITKNNPKKILFEITQNNINVYDNADTLILLNSINIPKINIDKLNIYLLGSNPSTCLIGGSIEEIIKKLKTEVKDIELEIDEFIKKYNTQEHIINLTKKYEEIKTYEQKRNEIRGLTRQQYLKNNIKIRENNTTLYINAFNTFMLMDIYLYIYIDKIPADQYTIQYNNLKELLTYLLTRGMRRLRAQIDNIKKQLETNTKELNSAIERLDSIKENKEKTRHEMATKKIKSIREKMKNIETTRDNLLFTRIYIYDRLREFIERNKIGNIPIIETTKATINKRQVKDTSPQESQSQEKTTEPTELKTLNKFLEKTADVIKEARGYIESKTDLKVNPIIKYVEFKDIFKFKLNEHEPEPEPKPSLNSMTDTAESYMSIRVNKFDNSIEGDIEGDMEGVVDENEAVEDAQPEVEPKAVVEAQADVEAKAVVEAQAEVEAKAVEDAQAVKIHFDEVDAQNEVYAQNEVDAPNEANQDKSNSFPNSFPNSSSTLDQKINIDYLFSSRDQKSREYIKTIDSKYIIINKEVIILPCSHNVSYTDKGKCDDTIKERFKRPNYGCKNISTNPTGDNCQNVIWSLNSTFNVSWSLYSAFTKRKFKVGPRKFKCTDKNINMLSLIIAYVTSSDKNNFDDIINRAKKIILTPESDSQLQPIGGYYNKYLKYKYKYLQLKNELSQNINI